MDLAAPEGTTIYSVAAGEVIFAGAGTRENGYRGFGHLVIIKHPDGTQSRYAHLCCGVKYKLDESSIAVKVGDKVTQGQAIGEIGTTGRSTGPHLHLEIRRGNRTMNPTLFLASVPRCYRDYVLGGLAVNGAR